MTKSSLQDARANYKPELPAILKQLDRLAFSTSASTANYDEVKELFTADLPDVITLCETEAKPKVSKPLRVGVLFSGGPAAGGHNVVAALFEALHRLHPASALIGFRGGAGGVIENEHFEITEAQVQSYRNSGGFDWLGTGRTKIESVEQFEKTKATLEHLNLQALVIIGGDDSNSNAAHLAEYLFKKKSPIQVIGVPKTIDGDMRGEGIEISFGFDTACKIYSEIIGNIAQDAVSAKKYTHFIKLMGRSASHVALECALATHPNYTLIGEQIAAANKTLHDIIDDLTKMIVQRAEQGKNYGVVLVPEGLIEFIPEMKELIGELNTVTLNSSQEMLKELSTSSKAIFLSLPEKIQKQLCLDRDPHGNVQVSHIATEELLIEMVKERLKHLNNKAVKFSAVSHFLGYEGRSGFPSNFDATYTYALGYTVAALIHLGLSGYIATVTNLRQPVSTWQCGAVALKTLMRWQMRRGQRVAVIAKKLVDLQGPVFAAFQESRNGWQLEDDYLKPGPMQFFGPSELTEAITHTLKLESSVKLHR